MSSPTPAQRPAGRYGDQPRRLRPGPVALVVALATAFVGWVVWAALGATAPDVQAQVTGFRVPGPHRIQVKVTVVADEGRVTCGLRALGKDREVVGVTTVDVRVGPSRRLEAEVPVRTRDTAVSAVLDDCRRPASAG